MRRASSSILASGCAFATTATCRRRLSTPSDDATVQFSAALDRLSDEVKSNLKAEMKDLMTEIIPKMNALEAEMQYVKKSIESDTRSWLKTNERINNVLCVVGFVVLAYAVQASFGLQPKVARAPERSQAPSGLVAGAASGDVFAKNAQRAAH